MGWGVFTKQMQKHFIYLEAPFWAAWIIWNTPNNKDVVKTATELPKYYQNQVPKLWLVTHTSVKCSSELIFS